MSIRNLVFFFLGAPQSRERPSRSLMAVCSYQYLVKLMNSSSRFSSLSPYVQVVLELVPTVPTPVAKKPFCFLRLSVLKLVPTVPTEVAKKPSRFSRSSVLELVPTVPTPVAKKPSRFLRSSVLELVPTGPQLYPFVWLIQRLLSPFPPKTTVLAKCINLGKVGTGRVPFADLAAVFAGIL